MTDNSRSKKRKITIRASPQGVEKAEKALIRLGFETKTNFAKSRLLSRSSVTKFFNLQAIQVDTFKKICDELELNWRETAEISVEKNSKRLEKYDCSLSESNKVVCEPQIQKYKVTVIDESSKESLACIILKGDINTVSNRKILESILQIYVGNSIEIIALEFGSIKLTVKGSKEDIKRLISKFESGELKELNGFPVEDIQVLNESLEDNESDDKSDKWRLVEDIVRRSVKNRNLRRADLSDADLSGADLSGADLSGADLSDADLSGANLISPKIAAYLRGAYLISANLIAASLSGTNLINARLSFTDLSDANLISPKIAANLSGANLRDANLRDANLSGANLRDANLSGANLSGANLRGANVKQAKFGKNSGLTEEMKLDLQRRGAIFEDSPGDRSEVLSRP